MFYVVLRSLNWSCNEGVEGYGASYEIRPGDNYIFPRRPFTTGGVRYGAREEGRYHNWDCLFWWSSDGRRRAA